MPLVYFSNMPQEDCGGLFRIAHFSQLSTDYVFGIQPGPPEFFSEFVRRANASSGQRAGDTDGEDFVVLG
jgi:hypothetical protein